MRVLQVLPALNIGGVERATLDMVAALRHAFPITYVASQGGSLLNNLERLGGTHFTLPLASKNPLQMLLNAYDLAQLIRTHSIELVHARSRAPAWSALWAARWTKTPFITTYHGTYLSSNAVKTYYNSVMTRGDQVIAISQFIAQYILQQHQNRSPKVRLIREGIDTDVFDPQKVPPEAALDLRKSWDIPENAVVILLPGRVSRIKGQTVFIEALRQLNVPNVFGVILGPDQPNSTYPTEVRQLSEGLPLRRILNTPIPRVAYAAADFVVYPSVTPEAFGRVTAETGAMERVIIASDLGATPELCQPGVTGCLVTPNDPSALAGTLQKALVMSPQERLAMGKAARAYMIKNFSLKRMCEETIALYQEILEKKKAA